MSTNIVNLGTGLVLTSLLLAFGHVATIHWKRDPDTDLPNLVRYVIGVLGIWAGFAYWRLTAGDWQMPLAFLLFAAAGGAAVAGTYAIDWLVLEIRKTRKAEAVDDDLDT